jgi:hypothetical protein
MVSTTSLDARGVIGLTVTEIRVSLTHEEARLVLQSLSMLQHIKREIIVFDGPAFAGMSDDQREKIDSIRRLMNKFYC